MSNLSGIYIDDSQPSVSSPSIHNYSSPNRTPPLIRANQTSIHSSSIIGTPITSPIGTPKSAPLSTPKSALSSISIMAAQVLPKIPGYEMAIYNEEIFIPCPHALPKDSEPIPLLKRNKSLFRRKSNRHQLQTEVYIQGNEEEEELIDDNEEDDTEINETDDNNISRSAPEEIVGPQVDSVIQFLQRELQLKPSAYSHALFSYALDGVAESVEERRSVMWVAHPITLTEEIESLLDRDPPYINNTDMLQPQTQPQTNNNNNNLLLPPKPWTVNFESCLPSTIESTYEVSLQVPNTLIYRTCFYCEGRGISKCITCLSNALILCKLCKSTGISKNGTMCNDCQGLGCKSCDKCRNSGRHQCNVCQGQGTLRLYILLKAKWQRHISRLIDSNNYPLQPDTQLGDLLAEVDATYIINNIMTLPNDMDTITQLEVNKFAEYLRIHMARSIMNNNANTSWIRSYVYSIRLIPLFELVYKHRKVFIGKKIIRYLVYGNTIRGVLRLGGSTIARTPSQSSLSIAHTA